jgi:hypothetical protein
MTAYGYETSTATNCFGADEHLVVTLYRLNKKGTTWKYVESWAYSTFLSSSLAEHRAARKARQLEQLYHAEYIG